MTSTPFNENYNYVSKYMVYNYYAGQIVEDGNFFGEKQSVNSALSGIGMMLVEGECVRKCTGESDIKNNSLYIFDECYGNNAENNIGAYEKIGETIYQALQYLADFTMWNFDDTGLKRIINFKQYRNDFIGKDRKEKVEK